MTVTMEPIRTRAAEPAPSGIHTLAEVSSYDRAERIVERLSDAGFPVERTRIVGHNLYSVEQVTGRMTAGRATLGAAAMGAGLGLLIGAIFSLFTAVAGWLVLLLGGLVIGSLWGAAFGLVTHLLTRGTRDVSSTRNLRAVRYAVQVEAAHAEDARNILGLP